jgi:hypothetical protein
LAFICLPALPAPPSVGTGADRQVVDRDFEIWNFSLQDLPPLV